jgi:hypothetical protein
MLESLLRLKSQETPGAGYLDEFLREFHGRRRQEAIKEASRGGFWQRFWDGTGDRFAYIAGFVCALAILGILIATHHFILKLDGDTGGARYSRPSPPVIQQVEQLDKLDLSPSDSPRYGDHEF